MINYPKRNTETFRCNFLMYKIKHNLKQILFWVFCLSYSTIFSQILIKGKVVDAKTNEALPFSTIQFKGTNNGVTADIDGNFSFYLTPTLNEIEVSLIGYEKQSILISNGVNTNKIVIKLKPKDINLLEVEVKASENPANKIINEVINRKEKHNINNLKNYICETYSKTYFTVSNKNGEEIKVKDTILNKQYLFLIESVTEKKYQYKNNTQEKIIASRTSGLKTQSFGNFASQMQSFTFYNDKINVLGIEYVNPLLKGTHQRYWFTITDSVVQNSDTTIIIRFAPKKNITVKAMEGLLYINKNDFVLSNVIAKPSQISENENEVTIQQLYTKIDSNYWFPNQLKTEIIFKSISVSEKDKFIKAVSKQYVTKANVDTVFKIKDKWLSVYNDKLELKRNEEFWNEKRVDSISKKEITTYKVLDSLGKEAKLDKKIKWLNVLMQGKINIGYFDYDLKYLLGANQYEGFRLGSGFSTSNKLSRFFKIGAYGAYGFNDKQFKYGVYTNIYFNKFQTTFLSYELFKDVEETAGFTTINEFSLLQSLSSNRNLLIKEMDKIGTGRLALNFNKGSINSSVYFLTKQVNSKFGYANYDNFTLNNTINTFNFNEVGLQIKYWPKQKFIQNLNFLMPIGSKWPQFYMSLAKGINTQILDYKSSFEYTKINFKILQNIKLKVKGTITYQLLAGLVTGNVPYSLQYNNYGSNTDKYWLSVPNSFETMYLNEFVSSKFAAVFINYNTGPIIRKNKYFNPNIDLLHNYGIGKMDNPDNITNLAIRSIDKGYTEVGMRLNGLITMNNTAYGIGVFYRYGNYSFENSAKNFTYKLSLSFKL